MNRSVGSGLVTLGPVGTMLVGAGSQCLPKGDKFWVDLMECSCLRIWRLIVFW